MIGNDWDNVLNDLFNSDHFKDLMNKIDLEYASKTIFPVKEDLFNALKFTPFNNVKVVIVGQDPYHGVGEAHGLSFSVRDGVKCPPSLKNIYKEIKSDLAIDEPNNGNLTKWALDGVLLINSTLTVVKDSPNSHKNIGWSYVTDEIIKRINEKDEPVVFILWGNFAKSKKSLITNKKHLIIESAHPSPFSARNGFFGSRPFSRTNEFLINNNIKPINWQL